MIRLPCEHGRTFEFEPARTAVLSIDMQRDFLDPRGYSAAGGEDVAPVRRVIPPAQRVLAAARAAGMLVVHTREGHRADLTDLAAAKQQRSTAAGAPIGAEGPLGRLLVRGEFGHDFVDELTPQPGEPVVDKPGFGAFYATDLERILLSRGVTHLLLMGVTTQCCVFSTLREAVDRGYYCCTLRDCCGAFSDDLQDSTFRMIASEGHLFGSISNSGALVSSLG